MSSLEKRLQDKLEQRKNNNYLRKLPEQLDLIDFCSNDYLGLARDLHLHRKIERRQKKNSITGSTGSRLLTGNSDFTMELESFLADLFKGEAALIFNSGYTANLALLGAIPQPGDSILIDELSHASIREGSRLGRAPRQMFRHNDLADLRNKLKTSDGEKFVVVESVYSMDGDQAPLKEITRLCNQYEANLIIDEAHSTGVFGERGSGLACHLELNKDIFARVYTFGKAMGGHGACVVGSDVLIQYLVNYARPFIFTTALPHHSLVSIWEAFHFLESRPELQASLHKNIALFRELIAQQLSGPTAFLDSSSAIQAMVVPGNAESKKASGKLRDLGFDVRPILYPSVAQGKERLRISLHAFNQESEIENLVEQIGRL